MVIRTLATDANNSIFSKIRRLYCTHTIGIIIDFNCHAHRFRNFQKKSWESFYDAHYHRNFLFRFTMAVRLSRAIDVNLLYIDNDSVSQRWRGSSRTVYDRHDLDGCAIIIAFISA